MLLGDGSEPLAISAKHLEKRRLYHDRSGGVDFVILTDRSGANRVYETRDVRFERWDDEHTAVDAEGIAWTLHEDRLESPRAPGSRACQPTELSGSVVLSPIRRPVWSAEALSLRDGQPYPSIPGS